MVRGHLLSDLGAALALESWIEMGPKSLNVTHSEWFFFIELVAAQSLHNYGSLLVEGDTDPMQLARCYCCGPLN